LLEGFIVLTFKKEHAKKLTEVENDKNKNKRDKNKRKDNKKKKIRKTNKQVI